MGLAGNVAPTEEGGGGERLPPSDPTRPPRLSRRDRNYYCFHLDFSAESQHLLPSLARYVLAYGARHSTFLDINVTHIITDKPLSLVQSSALVRKLGCKILTLTDFLQKIVDSYQRSVSRTNLRPPMSPILRKAAVELPHSKDLSHLLAEEKRLGLAGVVGRAGRAITPLYNAAAGALSANLTAALSKLKAEGNTAVVAGGALTGPQNPPEIPNVADQNPNTSTRHLGTIQDKKVTHEPFQHPFILLEESSYTFAPVYKEYSPSSQELCTYPMLNLDAAEFHCPWLSRHQGCSRPIAEIIPVVHQPVLVANHNKHRAAKTVRTLAQHRAVTEQVVINRPKAIPYGLGKAPLPSVNTIKTSKPTVERARPGFCECCYEKYSNLEKHLRQDSHRRLVSNTDFYRSVDRLVWQLVRPMVSERGCKEDLNSGNLESQERIKSFIQNIPPPSPAKSVASALPVRIKSIPLKNITNQIPLPIPPPAKPLQTAMDPIDVGSDSPIYSSPSLKRRRSQRLVGRSTRISTKFAL